MKDFELQLVSREWCMEEVLRGQHSVDVQLVPGSGHADLYQHSTAHVEGLISCGFLEKLGVPPPSRHENACWIGERLLHARRRLAGRRRLVARVRQY